MNRKKKIAIMYLLMLTMIFTDNISVLANNSTYTVTDGNEVSNACIPEEVDDYFDGVYENLVTGYIERNEFPACINVNSLEVESPFVIFNVDLSANGTVWYYPVSYENDIQFLVTIYYFDGNLCNGITNDYVDELNQIDYDSDMIILKDEDSIFVLDENDNVYFLNEYYLEDLSEYKDYDKWKGYIIQNYECDIVIEESNNIPYNVMTRGAIIETDGGYRLDMTGCLEDQWGYDICWAASVATIVRYLKPSTYSSLTAVDVAIAYGTHLGVYEPTTEGFANCMVGRKPTEVLASMELYDIDYYEKMGRKLTYYELKKSIKYKMPILMCSYYWDQKGNEYGHATVIYGYYYHGSMQYIEMWNPGTAQTQAFQYNLDGSVGYVYGGVVYSWENTLCNWYMIAK